MKTIKQQIQAAVSVDERQHTEDCIDANDDTSVLKGKCICPKEVKHTPAPWVEYSSANIVNEKGTLIASTANSADTRFIVRAVNSHEALLHACRRAFYLIKEGGFTHPMTEEFYDDTLRRLDKAITGAGGALTNPKDGE